MSIEREVGETEITANSALAPATRAPRIAQDDVFRAADELLLEGHRPTIDRVRMRLGRGSPNTINEHLDAWWAKLGARLRDLPGQEFPQLPERVSQTLQHLWNEALDGARAALQATLHEREQALLAREEELEFRSRELAEREQALTARASALEESLTLAREQLVQAHERAQASERTGQERDRECQRLRARVEALEGDCVGTRTRLDAATAAHQAERAALTERHASAERHWLLEIDRLRQQAKDAAREHEKDLKELRRRLEVTTSERDDCRQNLLDARAELKAAMAVREQLEDRVRAAERERAAERAAISSEKSNESRSLKQRRRLKSRRRTQRGSDGGSAS